MKKSTISKIRRCKALQGVAMLDICAGERFKNNLAAYFEAQKADREAIKQSYKAMTKLGAPRGYKLPAHTIDRLAGLTTEQLADEFVRVVMKVSARPHQERLYIEQIGQQAYNLTIAQIVIEEFPELESELIPKRNEN